jgi:hypothetical protein
MHSIKARACIVNAGNSFIRRWQRQYYLKKLEEQAKEASVHAQLDDLEQVSVALKLAILELEGRRNICIP